jgi:sirohydrochlorin ferrochelatase
MRIRTIVLGALILLAVPAFAQADQGILLLAQNGSSDWNTQVKSLAAKVDLRKPTEVVFGTPARSTIVDAVDRLTKRGVTEAVAVPFFLSTPIAPEALTAHTIPVKIGPSPAADPVLADIILARANEISRSPGDEVIVLIGYGAEDDGKPWLVDLSRAAQRVNQARRFGAILLAGRLDASTEKEQQQVRLYLDRQVGLGRRVLVVPVIVAAIGADPTIAQRLQGFSYDIATRGVIQDDRLVEWLVAQAEGGTR